MNYNGNYYCEGEGEVAQSCLTLCDPVDCSLPGFSIHGILQARILEWVTISFSRGSYEKFTVIFNSCSSTDKVFFSLCSFQDFVSPLIFCSLNTICIGVIMMFLVWYFVFPLINVSWISYIWGLVFVINFDTFSAIITSTVSSTLFFLSSPGILVFQLHQWYVHLLKMSHRPWMFVSKMFWFFII